MGLKRGFEKTGPDSQENYMTKLDDYRLNLGGTEYVPIVIGGMGMDISTSKLILEAARLGGIGNLSDALIGAVSDRHYGTHFTKERVKKYKKSAYLSNKLHAQFDLDHLYLAVKNLVSDAMEKKVGTGGVFINTMEKLSMNNPKDTMQVRLKACLDAGIDGITLSAGLHLNTLGYIEDHPRFRDAKIGIIVSSVRALKPFLKRAARLKRLPDFIVVEGPLAGGHLGFKVDDWFKYDLKSITVEIIQFLKENDLNIPVVPAGGIFTGGDAVEMMQAGASGIQVATRFVVTKESGFPNRVQQRFFRAEEEEIEVNMMSPTGYPMRMLKDSPCIGTGVKPNCEALGFILDGNGDCSYIPAYNREVEKHPGATRIRVPDKTCLCTYMKSYGTWTCGQKTYKLKETTNKLPDGSYQQLTAEEVWKDYLLSPDQNHILPELNTAPPSENEPNDAPIED